MSTVLGKHYTLNLQNQVTIMENFLLQGFCQETSRAFHPGKHKLFFNRLSKSQQEIMILMQFHVIQLVIVPALNRTIISMLCLLLANNCGDRCLEIRQCSGGFQAERFKQLSAECFSIHIILHRIVPVVWGIFLSFVAANNQCFSDACLRTITGSTSFPSEWQL